jgi:hypothetical protein
MCFVAFKMCGIFRYERTLDFSVRNAARVAIQRHNVIFFGELLAIMSSLRL